MSVVSMKELLEAGVHFGHQTARWNPKMDPYIFTERNGIHIIDLQQTVPMVNEAYEAIADVVADGGKVLFVGTKKQAQQSIEDEAKRCGMYYVTQRWLGGMLTNFETIRSRVDYLEEIEQMEEDGIFEVLPKKEVAQLENKMEKLERNLGGIRDMKRLPDIMFVVDPRKEQIAIKEAQRLDIPVIAIVDSNCDPDDAEYLIPGNDDAIRAVKLLAGLMADAVLGAQQGVSFDDEGAPEKTVEEEMLAEAEAKKED